MLNIACGQLAMSPNRYAQTGGSNPTIIKDEIKMSTRKRIILAAVRGCRNTRQIAKHCPNLTIIRDKNSQVKDIGRLEMIANLTKNQDHI